MMIYCNNSIETIMIYVFIFMIMLFIKESKGEWKLVWNEEFQNQTLDNEKWDIQNQLIQCDHVKQLKCNTNSNSTRNLQLINGTLAITAIHKKYLDKDYTSGNIATKQSFTYGKFEIRAALPNGKLLRPSISMIPEEFSHAWPLNGQIDIMTNDQTLKLESGIHYNYPEVYQTSNKGGFTASVSLNDFHTYSIEWNEFELKWFFNDINYMTININRNFGSIYNKNGSPFDLPFKLLINLGVDDRDLTVEDVRDWKCSLLIIDYVRIYEWVNGTEKQYSKDDRVSTGNICSHVMPLITPLKEELYQKTASNGLSIKPIILVIICSLLIPLIKLLK